MQGTRNRSAVLALLLAMALVAAACGSSAEEPSASGGGGGAQAAGGDAPTTFDVVLSEFAITPDTISAPEGKDLTFNVKNDGQAPHTFAIEAGEKTFITPTIEAGASATLEVTAQPAGDYKIVCTVPGHEQAGMVGNLTVGGAAAATDGMAGMNHANMSVGEMLAGHEQGVNDFVTNVTDPITEGIGAQPLKPEMDGQTKVFAITVDETEWEVAPGDVRHVMSYNGTVPGPEIRVFPGDRVRFEIQNDLEEPTTMHWHGLTVPNDQDGTPYVTQDPILPGEAYTYEFTIRDHPGLYMYHSHFNSTAQVEAGLYGPIVIQGRGKDEVQNDEEFTMIMGDGPLGFNINGKGFPATQAFPAAKGDTMLIHMANIGEMIHPMHMHGFHFTVISQDGQPVPRPYSVDTLMVAPGNTYDVLVETKYPGIWAFHCHILSHVEGPQGMYGMVTAVVVK